MNWSNNVVMIIFLCFLAVLFWLIHQDNRIKDGIYRFNAPATLPEQTFSVMTYNLGFACEDQKELSFEKSTCLKNLSAICETIKIYKPCILAVQEIDIHSKRSGFIDQIQYIQKNCGYPYVAVAITWNKKWVPYPFKLNPKYHWGKILAGQAIFSKYPLIKQDITVFTKPKSNHALYNWFYLNRIAQSVVIELENSKHVTLVNTHLEAFDKTTRQSQSNLLSTQLKTSLNHPLILCGDLNAIYGSIHRSFRFEDEPNVDYKNDTTLNNFIKLPCFKEVFSDSRIMDKKPCFTYPSKNPNRQLDYMFYTSAHLELQESAVLDPAKGSDHLPIFSKFKLTSC